MVQISYGRPLQNSKINLIIMVDQEGHFKKILSDPSQAQVDQKGQLSIRQLDAIATCLSTLDLEELTKVETSSELWHADIICGLG